MPQVQGLAAPTDETAQAADIVERFLVASMVPDPRTAARSRCGNLFVANAEPTRNDGEVLSVDEA